MFRRYLAFVAVVVVAGLSVIGAWNWFMDPFDMYQRPVWQGVNNIRVAFDTNARMAKPVKADQFDPDGLILGSSAAEVGLNPAHSGWKADRVFNMAMSGGNMLEARRYFDFLTERHDIEQVMLQFDFLMAHGTNSSDDASFVWLGIRDDPVTLIHRTFQSLFSVYAARSSLFGLSASRDSIGRDDDVSYLPNGQRGWRYYEYRMGRGVEYQFDNTEREYATGALFSGGRFRFSYPKPTSEAASAFDHLRWVVRRSHELGIDLRIILPPSHARYLVTLDGIGLWPAVELYKKSVVAIVEEEARAAQQEPVAIWDFFYASDYSAEPVPEGVAGRMQFYWDDVHFKSALGDLVLDVALSDDVPASFGVRLLSERLDETLEAQEAALSAYAIMHEAELSDLRAMIAETDSLRTSIDLTIP